MFRLQFFLATAYCIHTCGFSSLSRNAKHLQIVVTFVIALYHPKHYHILESKSRSNASSLIRFLLFKNKRVAESATCLISPHKHFTVFVNVTVNPIQYLDPFCDFHTNKPHCVSDKWFSDIKRWIISLCLGRKLNSLYSEPQNRLVCILDRHQMRMNSL